MCVKERRNKKERGGGNIRLASFCEKNKIERGELNLKNKPLGLQEKKMRRKLEIAL